MKPTAWTFMALAAAMVLSSCTSFPRPVSDQDTLLLIPASMNKRAGFPVYGHYRVHVAGDGGDAVIDIPPYGGYGFAHGLPPGRYSISEAVFQYDWEKVGSRITPDIHFEITPGAVTVVNTRFVTEIDTNAVGGVMRGWFVIPAKADMDAWVAHLGEDPGVRTWGQDRIHVDGTTQATGTVGSDESGDPERFFPIHQKM